MRCLLVACLASTALATSQATANFTFDELWSLSNKFWGNFLYPANLAQLNVSDQDSFFAEDIHGRVDVTRTFEGRPLNTEYIFGLFSDPSDASLVGLPVAYNITQFTANQNIISATAVLTFISPTFSNATYPITIDTWAMYNAAGQITQYDAVFRWLDLFFDNLLQTAAPAKFNSTDPATIQEKFTALLATQVCDAHGAYCAGGGNAQYSSVEECVDFLSNKIRFGKAYELGGDTLLCRALHKVMVRFRPEEHCPHIGPSGGGYCVDDRSYGGIVLQRYFKEAWIPGGYGDEDNVWVQY